MPAKGWKKEDSKWMDLHIRFSPCQNLILESVMKKFGYTNKSRFIWELISECHEYHINAPMKTEEERNYRTAQLKFFD